MNKSVLLNLEKPKLRQGYLKKLEAISRGRFIKVHNFFKRYLKR